MERKETFKKWFAWALTYGDCDPAVWLANYLNKRYEHNREQRFWFAWLFGNTYHLPTAWVMMNEFPDMELADIDRVEKWHDENYSRLRYQVDTKWSKPALPEMLQSYKELIAPYGTQEAFYDNLCPGSPGENFDACWNKVKEGQYKFGRYSTWFYLQQVSQTCGIPMKPSSLMLKDYSGSKSHRNGLCYALGKDKWINAKLSQEDYAWLEKEAKALLSDFHEEYPQLRAEADLFMMETALCSFKKLFRERRGRYLGYYLDRQSEEIKRVESDGWDGINWRVLWQAREETIPSSVLYKGKPKVDKSLFSYYLENKELYRGSWSIDNRINYGMEQKELCLY